MTAIQVSQHVGGTVFLSLPTWPDVTEIPDSIVRLSDPSRIALRYPFLTINLDNGHAVYRVETCDRGVWIGTLVESQVGA